MITLSERAAAKVRELLAARPEAGAGWGLRVGVRPGGCAGHEYTLAFAPAPEPGDHVLAAEGFAVFVDGASLPLLRGTRIDYLEGLQGAGFVFDNPRARSACGCGRSFAADAEAAEAADPALAARVEEVLAGIRPFLRGDGGDVELVDVRGGTVRVRLVGACSGCAAAGETLRLVVERRVREAVPEVERVVAV